MARTNAYLTLPVRIIGIGAVAIGLVFCAMGIISFGPRPEGKHDVRYLVAVGLYLVIAGLGTAALRRRFAMMLVVPLAGAAGILAIGSIVRVPWPASVGGILIGASLCILALLVFRRRSMLH